MDMVTAGGRGCVRGALAGLACVAIAPQLSLTYALVRVTVEASRSMAATYNGPPPDKSNQDSSPENTYIPRKDSSPGEEASEVASA